MINHKFISYSSVDAEDFAIQLYDALKAGPPSISVWLDERDLKPGRDWDEQIVEAIRVCDGLIFVMTCDSVEDKSVCKLEWTRALKYKKPIIPILLHPDAIPFRLGNRQYIEFTGDFGTALAQLRNHLKWLGSPEGMLRAIKDRLEDAWRDLRRARDPGQQARIEDEIALLEKQISEQQRIIDDPDGVARRVEESIARGIERERQPEKPVSGLPRTKFINPPPGVAPTYFQDRHVETKLIGDFLKNDAQRLMTIVGRAGMGKTVMVCRLLKALESGRLPDDGGPLKVDGIVYLSETGSHRVNVSNMYTDLCRLLPDDIANKLGKTFKDPKDATETKMRALLAAFPRGKVILMLDNLEELIDPETRNINNAELDEALCAFLTLPQHAVKVILTTRIAPRDLLLVQPGQQARLDLDRGLESPYAENILREMDVDGKVGLKSTPDELLDCARERTRGNPRALEALFAILSADRDTSLHEILNETARLPENVVEVLVGEAFNRLDTSAQQVTQALAVYARPVTPAAVDYLLQPHLSGVDSAPVLNRLLNMQFARKEAGRYYLHQIDRAYALSRVPRGDVSDREEIDAPPFTQFALLHRGADYFKQVRTPRENRKTIEDLNPQLSEFDLRSTGQDYNTAAGVLLEIDFDYLLLWGHYRLMAELHERLRDRIGKSYLKQRSVGNLGTAYSMMGQYQKAISCYGEALNVARETKDQKMEVRWLGNLGNCYADIGQIDCAIEYYEQALDIAQEIDDRQGERIYLGNLGNRYADIGQTDRAIECHKQALDISQELVDRQGEAMHLGNMGNCYADMGQTDRAIECCERSLDIAREIGYRLMESASLAYKGHALVDRGEWGKAVQSFNQAIEIADETGNTQFRNMARRGLALVHLHSGDLPAAHTACESARKYDFPQNNHNVLALLGVIALRQGDRTAAKEAFAAAVASAGVLLGHSEKNYDALDVRGLALCGLALCEEDRGYIPDAINAYEAARAINKDAGVVGRVLRLFDEMAKADLEHLLMEVRTLLDRYVQLPSTKKSGGR